MPTSQSTVDLIVEQSAGAGRVSARKMFGEFALYCDDKMVGSICDDQLFLKITASGRAMLDESHDAPPYAGAKPHLRVPRERRNDAAWLARLVRATADALPAPKPKGKAVR